jgi:hypothetical protein
MYTVIINEPGNVREHAETPSAVTAFKIAELFRNAYVVDDIGDVVTDDGTED